MPGAMNCRTSAWEGKVCGAATRTISSATGTRPTSVPATTPAPCSRRVMRRSLLGGEAPGDLVTRGPDPALHAPIAWPPAGLVQGVERGGQLLRIARGQLVDGVH